MNEEAMQIVLIEDEGWQALRPLTWLRPAGELIVGARTNAERWHETTATQPVSCCRREVAALDRERRAGEAPSGPARRLWVRDRWIPDAAWMREALATQTPTVWGSGDSLVAVLTESPPPAGAPPGSDEFWKELAEGCASGGPSGGAWLTELSDLVREGTRRIDSDLETQLGSTPSRDGVGDGLAYALGRIRVGKGCQIDHGAVLDAREGPIVLGAGSKVFPGTWIRGPFGCRENCLLLGGRIGGGSYLGPACRVRGELEASTLHGYVNKAHDGFVGHSYIGEWVNLGALTTISDLKNNYGSVHLEAYGRRIDTGQQKIGSFIGDHAKTRIGTLLNSGSVIGLAANLFGEAHLFPKWTPDFAWGGGPLTDVYDLDRCMGVVQIVMERRGVKCPPEIREAFEAAFRERKE
jgi:UDP-N-acetylglucosamine diphosphorylase / glucose-1-phosphate thymidylyltransferase / UDP-N-acetylgalactosamine diphosphorylase / glucosamine-1-phosphate N-acetyltransferase / galactosamine-1-phosphate N-acetyltransferase